jgi:hypothetical protein
MFGCLAICISGAALIVLAPAKRYFANNLVVGLIA